MLKYSSFMLLTRVHQLVESALPEKVDFTLEVPPDPKFGDLACNAAMVLAKNLKKNPRDVAEEIIKKLDKKYVEKVEIAGPGFLNLFLKAEFFQEVLIEIEKQGSQFGSNKLGKRQKVLLEFISANPTGPLTIANGRGGFGGDALANVFDWAGYEVLREYYVNDAGNQIKTLGKSIQAAAGQISAEDDFYQGEYVKELAEKYPAKIVKDAMQTGKSFADILMKDEIKPAIKEMKISSTISFYNESDLHAQSSVENCLAKLDKNIFSEDGAMWLKTTEHGDDKDRVLKKADQEWTYFAVDIAYHDFKLTRADKLIDIWGADHHGYIGRMQAAVECLGRKGDLKIIITQMVKLFQNGQEVKMSKRAGNFELMSDLIAEVGHDVARWFFVMRDWNTHLNFDLNLAKQQSADNPVFYVQYAHTRMASILAKAKEQLPKVDWQKGDLKLLTDPAEHVLIKKMAMLPDLVSEIAEDYAVHRLTVYARELAETFHRFYEQCRVIDSEKPELSAARLRLTATAKETLRIVLENLVGVSAPENM